MTDMADIDGPQTPIVISEADARGGQSRDEVAKSDTLVPMLAWGLGLAVVGVIAVFIFMNAQH